MVSRALERRLSPIFLLKKTPPARRPGAWITRYHPVQPPRGPSQPVTGPSVPPYCMFRRETPGAVIHGSPPPAHSVRRLSGGGRSRLSSLPSLYTSVILRGVSHFVKRRQKKSLLKKVLLQHNIGSFCKTRLMW